MSLFAYLLSGEWSEKAFHKLTCFFWLSGRSGNAPFKSGGEKTFQPAKSFFSHIQNYYCGPTAFGWGLGWLNAPWLCERWCSDTWDGHGMVMGLKALPSVTAPALAKPWHASSMLPGPQLMLRPKKYAKKNFTGWKVFSPRDRIEALQLRPTNQKKLFSLWKVFFWKSTTVMCSVKEGAQ